MTVPAAEEDAAAALLWEGGTCGIEVRPAATGDVELLAYFPEAPGLPATLASALAPLPSARLQSAPVPDVDWVARYRDGFRPFSVAGFRVVPPWEMSDDLAADGDLLVVDPGRAFGTGTHESTRLCLAFLRELAGRAPLGRVVDLGTGSGILAVAAVRLGGGPVTAVDVDPEAVAWAQRHALLNGVEMRIMRGDLTAALRPGHFDLVLANIAASLLVDRAGEIASLGAPAVVLSGFLTSDLDAVRRTYAPRSRLEARTDGEWAAVLVTAE